MAQAFVSIDIPASPDQVWQVIGGCGSLLAWLPDTRKSVVSEGCRVRHLSYGGGEIVVERLVAYDDAARSYTCAILKASFPITSYLSKMRVRGADDGRGARVEWSGRFASSGVSDQEASRLFQGIYEGRLKALASRFAVNEA
jgi:hypothetical protein